MNPLDPQNMEEKIRELEQKISQLRVGRRILMNLLEKSTQERLRQIVRLEKEIQLLKSQNRKYAAQLLFQRGIRPLDSSEEASDSFN